MLEKVFPKKLGGSVGIDICHGCSGLWFDTAENLQIAPQGTLQLFKIIHEQHTAERNSLAESMVCPRCSAGLVQTYDIAKNTRFAYQRCPESHGRFITFFQFLREKNFVHQLTPKELQALKAQVRVINCSNCGAPVDLHQSMQCDHCRAPISVLDPNRVKEMLEELHAKSQRQQPPELVAMDLQLHKMRVEAMYSALDQQRSFGRRPGFRNDLIDLGLGAVGALLAGILS
jgi:hypothetical protein